jgi:hypothetical protein
VRYSVGSAFGNNGQVCAALSRMVVPRSILEEVEQLVKREVAQYVPADLLQASTKLRPLVSKQQRDRLDAIIAASIEEGSRVLVGGDSHAVDLPDEIAGGFYVNPTVFTDVDPQSTIGQQEAFGPVLALIPYDGGDDDALAIANGTPYGLNAAVWAEDTDRATRFAASVDTSTVYINAGKFNPSAPRHPSGQSCDPLSSAFRKSLIPRFPTGVVSTSSGTPDVVSVNVTCRTVPRRLCATVRCERGIRVNSPNFFHDPNSPDRLRPSAYSVVSDSASTTDGGIF